MRRASAWRASHRGGALERVFGMHRSYARSCAAACPLLHTVELRFGLRKQETSTSCAIADTRLAHGALLSRYEEAASGAHDVGVRIGSHLTRPRASQRGDPH